MPIWTDDQIATLKELWSSGLSAGQIARRMDGVTRCAVLGKLSRSKLLRTRPCQSKKTKQEKPTKRRVHANGLAIMSLNQRAQRLDRLNVSIVPEFDAVGKPSTFCTLLELTESRCRWPIGEPGSPDFGYCGGTREFRSYCITHARIAYVPVKKR